MKLVQSDEVGDPKKFFVPVPDEDITKGPWSHLQFNGQWTFFWYHWFRLFSLDESELELGKSNYFHFCDGTHTLVVYRFTLDFPE